MFFIVITVTYNMVVKTRLPNVAAVFFVAKALKRGYKLRAGGVCPFDICRDRRPRLSVIGHIIFRYAKQKVNMVRHYHVILNR